MLNILIARQPRHIFTEVVLVFLLLLLVVVSSLLKSLCSLSSCWHWPSWKTVRILSLLLSARGKFTYASYTMSKSL